MRWILHFRVCIIICLAVVLITAAVLFSVLRAALPYATGYKIEIQQEISQQIGLPVEIESIDAAIDWFSPRLRLIGVSVFDEKNKVPLFNFQEAFVELDVVASIIHRAIIVDDVGLIGAELSIEKLSDNEWLIQGIKFTSEGSNELPEKFLYMIQNADYLLHDSDIYYQDHTGEKLNLSLIDVNIDVRNSFNNHDIKFSMNLPKEYGREIAVVANLNGDLDSLAGDIYVEAKQIKIRQWNEKFKLLITHQVDAVVDVNLWASIEDNSFQTLSAQLTSTAVSIKNNLTRKSWATNYLASNIRLVHDKDFWNIALTDFSFGEKSKPDWHRPVNILASNDADYFYLSADFLRLTDLRNMAEVILNKDQLTDLDEFDHYKLSADVFNLNVKSPREMSDSGLLEKLSFDAVLVDFSMYEKSRDINVSGIDASFNYDKQLLSIEFETKNAEVEIKNLFREKLHAEVIQGELNLKHIDGVWQLTSDQLQVKNSQINTFSRFDVRIPAGEKIFIDAETDFYDGDAKYAKHYLPVGVMDDELIDWLDMSIIDGFVPEGKFILRGDISEFPFPDNTGVFQIYFTAKDASMLFLEQWPLLTDLNATVKFNNSSLAVSNGKARTENAQISSAHAEIAHLIKPHLTVALNAHGNNDDIQSYVWNSPLDKILGDAMRLFQFDGESDLSLKLDVPLVSGAEEFSVDGHLNFIDTAIYYPTLGYELSKLNGVVDFTGDSVFADALDGVINGEKVAINAFTRQGDSGRENVFHLDGVLDLDYLLKRYDWIPADWLSGRSLWAVDISIPSVAKDYLAHVDARTTLQGVTAQISDQLQKSADTKLLLSTSIDVMHADGLHIDAIISEAISDGGEVADHPVVDLYAVRNEADIWNFDIDSKYITGKGELTEGLGRDTSIELDLKNIDLYTLFFSEKKAQSKALIPSELPRLNWKAEQLLWDGWKFTDVVVNTDRNEHGMLINTVSLKGPAMTFDASGSWLTSWSGRHETVLRGKVSGDNFGDTLTGLGFQRSVDRSQYSSTFDARWSAEPYGWSWANMKGKTSFEMKNGEILDVDPGTGGRLLGLLNIFKLANRLAFDFDDVTRKGFAFDYMKGEFEFVNGDGSLKNFDISAPAADINIFGSVGLLERDYGLLMRVKPHTDTLTFAGGTLLGGFVVGAGLALIQKVFDLSVLGHNVYSVTGSWDDPKVEKIVEKRAQTTEEDDF